MSKSVPSITVAEWEHIENLAWIVYDSGMSDQNAIDELIEDIVNRAKRRLVRARRHDG